MGLLVIDGVRPFEIRQERAGDDGALTMRLSGEFDIAVCAEFEAALEGLDLTAVHELVIDLGSVTFIDSGAIRALLCTKTHADRNGLRLSVSLPPGDGQVRKIIELTGIDDVFSDRDGLP